MLDDVALPLVKLGRLLRVLHVAVGTGLAVLAVPGDEVDARAPANLRVPEAALAGQQREELRRDLIRAPGLLLALRHIAGGGVGGAGAASCSGSLALL